MLIITATFLLLHILFLQLNRNPLQHCIFTVTFDLFNASLVYKNMNLLLGKVSTHAEQRVIFQWESKECVRVCAALRTLISVRAEWVLGR